MQQDAGTISGDVDAEIRYIVRGEKATFYAGDRDRSYWPGEDHTVTIHDIRGEKGRLAFDRNGFVVLDEPSPVTDFDDPAQLATYNRYCEDTVQRLTGASQGRQLRGDPPHQFHRHARAQPARHWRARGLRCENRGRLHPPDPACRGS